MWGPTYSNVYISTKNWYLVEISSLDLGKFIQLFSEMVYFYTRWGPLTEFGAFLILVQNCNFLKKYIFVEKSLLNITYA